MNGLLRKDFLFIAKKYKVSLLFLLVAALPALEKERVDLILGVYLFAIMLSIQSDLVTASKEKKLEESGGIPAGFSFGDRIGKIYCSAAVPVGGEHCVFAFFRAGKEYGRKKCLGSPSHVYFFNGFLLYCAFLADSRIIPVWKTGRSGCFSFISSDSLYCDRGNPLVGLGRFRRIFHTFPRPGQYLPDGRGRGADGAFLAAFHPYLPQSGQIRERMDFG